MISFTNFNKSVGSRSIPVFFCLLVFLNGCKNDPKPADIKSNEVPSVEKVKPENKDTIDVKQDENGSDDPTPSMGNVDLTSWTELTDDDGFELDIRYATTNNFTKKQIYDCGKCFLRAEAAEKLKVINQELKDKFGYGIKIFDCYRPGPYQQKLWDIVPNPNYVTPPNKGSMHSRGLAIDLTIVDKDGKELDMGTEFDFFGPEAHHGYNHSDVVKRHRWILKSTMDKHGFASIRTEWWHYSYKNKSYPLDKWVWDCK